MECHFLYIYIRVLKNLSQNPLIYERKLGCKIDWLAWKGAGQARSAWPAPFHANQSILQPCINNLGFFLFWPNHSLSYITHHLSLTITWYFPLYTSISLTHSSTLLIVQWWVIEPTLTLSKIRLFQKFFFSSLHFLGPGIH